MVHFKIYDFFKITILQSHNQSRLFVAVLYVRAKFDNALMYTVYLYYIIIGRRDAGDEHQQKYTKKFFFSFLVLANL